MYIALARLEKWYKKYSHQVIEISGVEGTGIQEVLKRFIEIIGFDPREIMYLTYDQKRVLELASKCYHAYHLNNIIYRYTKIVDFNSLPVINDQSTQVSYKVKKEVRKKLPDEKYHLMIVFDSVLLTEETLKDLMSFGLPIILVRDPMLIPATDSYVFMRDPNIELRELHTELLKKPITYFANKVLRGEKINFGNYDTVSVVPKKQMNLYNLKSADMILTLSNELSDSINRTYREKVMNVKDTRTLPEERVICMNTLYNEKLVNEDEKRIKIYLTKGTIGYISRCPKHALVTRYIPIDFRMEAYHESFQELYIDRCYLNGIDNTPSRQQMPDEVLYIKYAYALSADMARLSHWDKITLVIDTPEYDDLVYRKELYSAITRSTRALTMVL